MAASTGDERASTSDRPSNNWRRRMPEAPIRVGDHRAAGHIAEPDPIGVDDAPAGAPQARIDADDANRAPHEQIVAQAPHLTIGRRRAGEQILLTQR